MAKIMRGVGKELIFTSLVWTISWIHNWPQFVDSETMREVRKGGFDTRNVSLGLFPGFKGKLRTSVQVCCSAKPNICMFGSSTIHIIRSHNPDICLMKTERSTW